jgi:1-acyl-sn-glycerol-3-phosphate acyltransferase
VKRILQWVLTVPFWIGFGLCLLFYDIAGRIVRPFSLRAFEAVMGALQWSLMKTFALLGTRIIVERDDAIESNTGYVIISNHQSLVDIVMIGALLFTNYPKYVAKSELGKWIPSVSLNLKHGGNALIDRKDRSQSIRSIIEMAKEAQRRNVSVVIFPEGTRSGTGELGPFRPAGSAALLKAADRLPVIPTAIEGSWRLHSLWPAPIGTKVRIRFGAPLARFKDDHEQLLEASRAIIDETLRSWAATAPA